MTTSIDLNGEELGTIKQTLEDQYRATANVYNLISNQHDEDDDVIVMFQKARQMNAILKIQELYFKLFGTFIDE